MVLFTKKEPILEYSGNSLENIISQLNDLKPKLNAEGQRIIEEDIKFFNIGYLGEKQLLFELKNSHMPLHIFYDVNLEYEDLKSQIDFIIIGEYKIFIIECKNYVGDIVIDNQGNFIRKYNNKKEGIYSPITQNERHTKLLIEKIKSRQTSFWKLRNFNFDKEFIPVVVFTNPKNVIQMHYAPKTIKNKIIRNDKLIEFIKENDKGDYKFSKTYVESIGEFIKFHTIEKSKNLSEKYREYINENPLKINIDSLREELTKYRLLKSREANIKPYMIFNNDELDELLKKLPKSLEDLALVKGFGDYKINKWGRDIINIIKNGQ